MVWVSIGYVANLFGVSTQTIRNWCREGMFKVIRTQGGHRRFLLDEIEESRGDSSKSTIIYSRVSSHDQKSDLKRQTQELEAYCRAEGMENIEVIEDIGSGINYRKRGLKRLLRDVILGKVRRIIVSYQDRLVRFGHELLFDLCRLMNVEIIVKNQRADKTFEQQLVEDVLTILIVYSSKIYGKRSHEKRPKSAQAEKKTRSRTSQTVRQTLFPAG